MRNERFRALRMTRLGEAALSLLFVATLGVPLARAQTPYLVKDIYPGGDSNLDQFAVLRGALFFAAFDYPGTGTELWRSNGTAAGTVLVQDINPGWRHSSPMELTPMNGWLFFSANDFWHGRELWRGGIGGATLVKDIEPEPPSEAHLLSSPHALTRVGDTLFFAAFDSTHGGELWKSDGSETGTTLVRDILPGRSSSLLPLPTTHLVDIDGTLFFAVNDGVNGNELWKSDGTFAGTVLVSDIVPGSGSSDPSAYFAFGGAAYFAANDGINGREIWKSDGTSAGTQILCDIAPGASSSDPTGFVVVGSRFFFTATDGTTGNELWMSDGTPAGTRLVRDIWPGALSSAPASITAVGSTVFFAAEEGTSGRELWKSNGTPEGTTRVRDINAGPAGSEPRYLLNGNGTLFFAAREGLDDRLWKSDGTENGTQRLSDIASEPQQLVLADTLVFFSARSMWEGRELWAVSTLPPPPGQQFYTVTPCRVLDTREINGPYGGPALSSTDGPRTFVLADTCTLPADARAVSINVTVTGASEAGDLRLYPGATVAPLASAINYASGQTRASNTVVALGVGGTLTIQCDQPSGSVHAIVDINGYFR